MKNRRRLETLYRVMYESFTPAMMGRTPMWLKRRIATALGYRLVPELTADAFMKALFTTKLHEPTPMSVTMFDTSVGGTELRPFFRLSFHWWMARRVWRGETHTAAQRTELDRTQKLANVQFPGIPSPREIPQRRRLP